MRFKRIGFRFSGARPVSGAIQRIAHRKAGVNRKMKKRLARALARGHCDKVMIVPSICLVNLGNEAEDEGSFSKNLGRNSFAAAALLLHRSLEDQPMRRTLFAFASAAVLMAGSTVAYAQEAPAAGAAAGATTGAVTGAIVGGPIGAVVGGAAGAAIGAGAGSAAEAPRERVYVAPGAPTVERTCVEDSYGNQRCREVVR